MRLRDSQAAPDVAMAASESHKAHYVRRLTQITSLATTSPPLSRIRHTM